MPQVGEENVQFGQVGQIAASRLADRLEVVKHPADLCLNALNQRHGVGVQTNLAGQVYSLVAADRLRIGANGSRGVFGVDDGTGHGQGPR